MASVVAVGSITIVDVMDGKTGGALMVSPSRALAFTATDGVLDVGQQNITFTAKVQGIEASTYLWEFTGFETYPTNSGTFAQTVTAAQFGNAKAATVTCTIDGTYSESFTISRLEKSSAEAGATKGADWSSNITGIPYDKIYSTDAATNLGFNPSFESWTGQFPAGWGNWSVSGGTISKDTTVVRFGSNSVKMVASGASQLGFQRRVGFGSPMPAGTFVSGSVDMYLESIVSALPMMLVRLFVNAELTTYKDTFVLPSPTTGSWQKIPFSARVASNQQIYGIQIYMMGAYGGWSASGGLFNGTVYFDGLSFSFNEASMDAALKLNKAGDTITGRINMAVADGIFAGTDLNNGVYMGNGGIVGKKAGATTFAIDTAGNVIFKGNIEGSTGVFNGTLNAETLNAVGTLNIKGNAITVPSSHYSGSNVAVTSVTVDIPCPVLVIGSFTMVQTSGMRIQKSTDNVNWTHLWSGAADNGTQATFATTTTIAAGTTYFRAVNDYGSVNKPTAIVAMATKR